MRDVLSRASAAFLTPAAPSRRSAASRVLPPTAVVFGSGPGAVPLAAMVAGDLRRLSGTRTALVSVWRSAVPTRPAYPAARRLAGRLAARGLAATAAGRLAWLALPEPPQTAAAAHTRAAGAAECPAVLVVAGPRSAAFDRLLDDHDLVVVALEDGDDGPLADVARAGLAAVRPPVVTCSVPPSGPRRVLAAMGLGRLPAASSLRAAVEALS